MQLELSPQIEQALNQESKSLGITPTELSAQILAQHASHWESTQTAQTDRNKWTIDDYIEYIKSRNPHYDTANPYAVDWQAIRSEGRKY